MEGLNLLALASELEHTGQYRDFISKVKRATAVASAHQDLRNAKEALTLLNNRKAADRSNATQPNFTLNDDEADIGVISGALLSHATILYTRATETAPIDRFKWFGRELLTERLRPFHDEVMRYRDRALAHFGLDPSLEDGPAVTHALVLKSPAQENQIVISYVESRALTRSRFTEKLTELVTHLIPIAHQRFDDRLSEVWEAFKSEVAGRKDLAPSLGRATFRTEMLGVGPTEFFDDDEARELSAHYMVRKPRTDKDNRTQ